MFVGAMDERQMLANICGGEPFKVSILARLYPKTPTDSNKQSYTSSID